MLIVDRVTQRSVCLTYGKIGIAVILDPLNSDLSQTSHCNIKGLLVREVMRTKNMITRVKFY